MHSGYNVTVFAYGQTGTGKTYTVLGEAGEGRGIVPRFVEDVMARATAERGAAAAAAPLADGAALDDAAAEAAPKLLVESTLERVCLGVYEVYEGKVFDLLRPDDGGGGGALAADGQGPLGTQVTLEMEKPRAGIEGRSYWVKGCAGEREIASADEAMGLVRGAARLRHTSAHKLNETSSRSHCIVSLSLRRRREVFKLGRGADGAWRYAPQPQKSAELVTRANLVDLAGSEDQRDTQSSGSTLREAADINRSLFTLRKAIEHLALKKHSRAVFQEETLTKLLASSLLGQAYALMIATISPLAAAARHTRNTLHYAGTASAIQLSAPKPAEDDFQLRNLELQKRNRALLNQLEQSGRAYTDLEARMAAILAERAAGDAEAADGGGGGDADADGELAVGVGVAAAAAVGCLGVAGGALGEDRRHARLEVGVRAAALLELVEERAVALLQLEVAQLEVVLGGLRRRELDRRGGARVVQRVARVARGGGERRDRRDHQRVRLAEERRREELGERLLLEDGARVLLEREVLDRLAQREERAVDVGGLAQRRARRLRVALVLAAGEVDEVGARHELGALLRLRRVPPRAVGAAAELEDLAPPAERERDDAVRARRRLVELVRRRVPQPRRAAHEAHRLVGRRDLALARAALDPVAAPLDAGARLLHLERHLRAERPLAVRRERAAAAAVVGPQQVEDLALVHLVHAEAHALERRLDEQLRRRLRRRVVERRAVGQRRRRRRRAALRRRARHHVLDKARHDPAALARLAEHRVRLARARLPVGEDGHVVPAVHLRRVRAHQLGVQPLLRRRRVVVLRHGQDEELRSCGRKTSKTVPDLRRHAYGIGGVSPELRRAV